MWINTELANKYQEFFNFISQEHNLTLTISEMNDILSEAKKLESKLHQHTVIGAVCDNEWHESNMQHFGECHACGLKVEY